MSSQTDQSRRPSRAEHEFRDAFDRLKRDRPQNLSKGTPVSQNNVAKEAGCDPSALRKSRYPSLIEEIQRWIQSRAPEVSPSPRQTVLAQRKRNRTLKQRINDLKAQRDSLASLLVEADAKILELTLENARLQSRNANPLPPRSAHFPSSPRPVGSKPSLAK